MTGLEDKVAQGLNLLRRIAATHGTEGVAVAWTGGKDSTVALHLWRLVLQEVAPHERPLVISLDTGCKFPEIVAFRDRVAGEWELDLRVVRPDVGPGYPVAVDRVACCRDLKVTPLLGALRAGCVRVLLTGVRADENPDRAGRPVTERLDDPPHQRVHPLLAFGEMDIWAYIASRGLPYCSLYDAGYRSLGCVPCTRLTPIGGERAGRDAEKEASMNALHALGYF